MTIETIYYIGQTVAVVIIIATLVAVLFQMRQSHRLARLESTRAIWTDAGTRLVSQVDDPEKADFLQRALFGTADLTDAEKTRFYILLAGLFVAFENGYTMHQSGMIADRFWPRLRDSMRDYLGAPRGERWWRIARKRTFGGNPEFCAEVDALLAELKAGREQS